MKAKERMKIQVQLEEYSQMLQVCISALKYIAKHVGPQRKPPVPAYKVAREALDHLRNIKEIAKDHQAKIKSGEIEDMTSPSKVPPRMQVAEGGEITFTRENDLYFHQCCDCGLIHEVAVDWQDDIDGSGNQYTALVTKWTRRAGPPTREEMIERGIEIQEVH